MDYNQWQFPTHRHMVVAIFFYLIKLPFVRVGSFVGGIFLAIENVSFVVLSLPCVNLLDLHTRMENWQSIFFFCATSWLYRNVLSFDGFIAVSGFNCLVWVLVVFRLLC